MEKFESDVFPEERFQSSINILESHKRSVRLERTSSQILAQELEEVRDARFLALDSEWTR